MALSFRFGKQAAEVFRSGELAALNDQAAAETEGMPFGNKPFIFVLDAVKVRHMGEADRPADDFAAGKADGVNERVPEHVLEQARRRGVRFHALGAPKV